MTRISDELVDDVLTRVGIAALYYDEADAATGGGTVLRDVEFVLEPLTLALMSAADRDQVRTLCQRAIVDPTTYRRELLQLLLGTGAEESAAQ